MTDTDSTEAPPETSYPTMSDLLAMISVEQSPKARPDGGSTSFNALAFSTLLSSQETDAHRCEIFISRRGDSFNLPGMFFPVKSAVPIKSDSI